MVIDYGYYEGEEEYYFTYLHWEVEDAYKYRVVCHKTKYDEYVKWCNKNKEKFENGDNIIKEELIYVKERKEKKLIGMN